MHRIAMLAAVGLLACGAPASAGTVAGTVQGSGEAAPDGDAPAAVAPGAALSTTTSFAPAFSTDGPAGAARAVQGREPAGGDPAAAGNTGLSHSTLQLLLVPPSDDGDKP